MKNKQSNQQPWDEKQVTRLVELIVEYGIDFRKITRKHNSEFKTKRTEKAVKGAYCRLKDAYSYSKFKTAWAMIEENADLFLRVPRVNRTAELQERNERLESQVDALTQKLERLIEAYEGERLKRKEAERAIPEESTLSYGSGVLS